MQVSIVYLSSLVSDSRLDAECYKQTYIDNENLLFSKSHTCIGKETEKFSKGAFDINAECYVESGIPFVRISDLKGMVIEESQLVYINEKENKKYPNSILDKEDVVISKTAYPAASLVTTDTANTSQDTIAVKLKKDSKISGKFLTLFLNTRYGYLQMLRWFTGNIQMHLNLKDSKNILIPIFSDEFYKAVELVFQRGIDIFNISKLKYQQTQNILLSELGLINWQPKHQLAYVKNYSGIKSAKRIDAECFQPKYEKLIEIISSNAAYMKKVSDLQCHNARGLQPQYVEDGALDVVTSKHILEDGLDYEAFDKTDASNWMSQKKARIYQGDILTYTTGANIGRTSYYSREEHALASNHVNILRIDHECSEYVAFVMNSVIGRLQTEQLCAGSAQVELYPKDIEKFVIPFIHSEQQKVIVELLAKSQQFKAQSRHLLECGKQAVEIAIEHNEETAIAWLKKEAEAMDAGL